MEKENINEENKKLFPILRENGMFFIINFLMMVFTELKKFLKEEKITTEDKRMVLPIPLTLNKLGMLKVKLI